MRNTIKTFKSGNTQSFIEHVLAVKNNLGIRTAAGMMRNKGWSIEAALHILTTK